MLSQTRWTSSITERYNNDNELERDFLLAHELTRKIELQPVEPTVKDRHPYGNPYTLRLMSRFKMPSRRTDFPAASSTGVPAALIPRRTIQGTLSMGNDKEWSGMTRGFIANIGRPVDPNVTALSVVARGETEESRTQAQKHELSLLEEAYFTRHEIHQLFLTEEQSLFVAPENLKRSRDEKDGEPCMKKAKLMADGCQDSAMQPRSLTLDEALAWAGHVAIHENPEESRLSREQLERNLLKWDSKQPHHQKSALDESNVDEPDLDEPSPSEPDIESSFDELYEILMEERRVEAEHLAEEFLNV